MTPGDPNDGTRTPKVLHFERWIRRAKIPAFLLGAGLFAFHVCLPAADFTEPPQLHAEVLAGRLPPLEQRLPTVPLVVSPIEKPGRYGGAWRMYLNGHEHGTLLSRTIGYEQLVRWDPNWSRVVPNVASSWTVSADATTYEFRLRPGMRWSDGHPFTAQDIVAWIEDVAADTELNPVPPPWLLVNGRLPACTAEGEHLVRFRFSEPNALFLEQLAGMRANELTRYPAHYFRPLHRRHSPAAAEALAKALNVTWAEAFRTRYTPWTWRNQQTPTLDAWVLETPYLPGAGELRAVRNPYYWKVDTLGRQLPYLDRLTMPIVDGDTKIAEFIIAGDIGYQREGGLGPANRSKALEAEREKRIRTVRIIPSIPGSTAINLNLTHRDPELRRVLGNRDVRVALSQAIDRERIIREVYGGEGRPWQVAPRPESPFHHRRLGTQYTELDRSGANRLLDAAGVMRPAGEAVRRLGDGRPFAIRGLVPGLGNNEWPAVLDRVREDWREVGVDFEWEVVPRERFYQLVDDNRHDAAIWWPGGGHSVALEPEYYVPITFERLGPLRVPYAVPWARWFLDPHAPNAEEPPAPVRQQMEVFRKIVAEPDNRKRAELVARLLDESAEQFYVLGIGLEPVTLAARSPGFRNVPASHYGSWLYPDPGPLNPCQFFLDAPDAPPQ